MVYRCSPLRARRIEPQYTLRLLWVSRWPLTKDLEASMRHRILLYLSVLALAVLSTFTAHASACSNATIQGTYAFTIRGTIFLPNGSTLLIDGIARETFDGRGNETQVDAVATNGVLTPGWRPGSGSYSVNPDCTGTQTILVPGLPDLHLQFVV